MLAEGAESERSWCVSIEEIEERGYDLKAINPNKKMIEDTRTPEELISTIDSLTGEVDKALTALKRKMARKP